MSNLIETNGARIEISATDDKRKVTLNTLDCFGSAFVSLDGKQAKQLTDALKEAFNDSDKVRMINVRTLLATIAVGAIINSTALYFLIF